jgi:hypothetical protein
MGHFADVQGGERQHCQSDAGGEQGRAYGEDQRGQEQRQRNRDHDEPGRLGVAAAGQLNGVAVTTFAYSTSSGARLIIFRSSQPFPEATGARELGGTEGAWTMWSSGVTIICAQGTHALLLLGSDATLVRQAGALLNAI